MESQPPKSERIVKNIFKGTVSTQILQISTVILNIIYSIILLRLLPPREVGLLELSGAPIGILFISTNLGLDSSIIHFLSKSKRNTESSVKDIMFTGFALRMTAVLFCAILLLFLSENVAIFYGEPLIATLLRIKALHFFVSSLGGIAGATFIAYHKYEYSIYILVSNQLLTLVVVPLLVILGYGVIGAAIGELIAGTVLAAATLLVWKRFFPKDGADFHFKDTTKYLLAYGMPLAVGGVFSSISTNSGKLILGAFGPPDWVAYYSLAYNIFNLPLKAASTTSTALFPTMSELEAEKDGNYLAKTFRLITKYLAIISTVLVGSILIFADQVIVLLYTQRYSPAILLAQIMVIGNAFRFIGIPIGTLLLAQGKTKILTISSGVRLVTTIILEILLILNFGLIGASVAKVLGSLSSTIFLILFTKSRLKQVSINFNYLIKILCIFASSCVISFLLIDLLTSFGSFALYLVLFILFVIIFRGFTKQDLAMLAPVLDFFPHRLSLFMRRLGMLFYSILRGEEQ